MLQIDENQLQEVGLGSNVKAVQIGNKLVLVIDLTQDLGLSSSGKMRAVGNTSGFQNMPGGLRGNVYIGKKA